MGKLSVYIWASIQCHKINVTSNYIADNFQTNGKQCAHEHASLKGIYPEFQVIRGFSQKILADLLSYDQIHS